MELSENESDNIAHSGALCKTSVLTGRQLLLVELIENKLKEYYDGPGKNAGVASLTLVIEQGMRYLRQGYLYFADLGISTESQFRFVELEYVSKELEAELEKAPQVYEKVMGDGESRQGHYQRKLFNALLAVTSKNRQEVRVP